MKRPTHPLQVLGDVGETRPIEALLGTLVVAQQSINLIHLRFRIVTAELNEALEIIGLEIDSGYRISYECVCCVPSPRVMKRKARGNSASYSLASSPRSRDGRISSIWIGRIP